MVPGAAAPFDSARAEYAYFNNDVDDAIVLVESSTQVAKPFNVGAARLRGHELAITATSFSHVTTTLNYTHQDAENRSAAAGGNYRGKQLPGRPVDELYTRLELFNTLGAVYYEFNYIGDNFLDQINFRHVASRDLHSLGFAVRASALLTLRFEARNLTANQVSDVFGSPLPGRAFFGTVGYTF